MVLYLHFLLGCVEFEDGWKVLYDILLFFQ